ncbi:MAG: DUF480 domain-containing protein [gamma proteobacterium symbiont of Ctena orbiculata]|uniref:DUF480 domain-containing protein n=1 Tax=Candidatus Thiodiazotropha taylori TaxID=2792791 RepID=A0A944MB41_9GAMM|nr:DUF480 domain-containing protein [Candidatus Thiodiazotropha taylori]PUB90616.1 MAG: DUF480 domain-containing protein [gamma proteobacterium symbiont of Ctena orbiculata]MBT2990629.1 DUF480 domain-containing protein [Candidatus Thiodiazotropha taylori]MBT2998876.1 DUF480 domain-containing protein [Candidatus Thiodiazotropha taylori]MBT3002824.1 DUF480 domain-containing protein [Candidatus Thiodiazotropha taylori]
MKIEITPLEARVIGCLLEKEVTTPDQYPLSLSALTNACNQKSSRDPVLQLDEAEVQDLLDELKKKHLVSDRTGFGSRVAKYQHRFCNTGFGALEFTQQELGTLCVLLLRGPQTPGELRSRSNRLCQFSDVQEVEAVLRGLMQREDGPFVMRLAREPGRREARYAHLFCGDIDENSDFVAVESIDTQQQAGQSARIERLESLLSEMASELADLKARIEALESDHN